MNSHIAIRVEALGKRYRIHHAGKGAVYQYRSLRDVLTGAAKAPIMVTRDWLRGVTSAKRGNPPMGSGAAGSDPGELSTTGTSLKACDEDFWALKDVSFDIKRGEVVGVIGRNGAGKSTLLKILSRITEPTTGRVELFGRVGSLLEVGTGFHPELTGRENIFLNGAILGMKRAEILRKFDEIVAFSEIEKFLDTPVKHYSSGMYVRLAFAVAAHLEPEILIVDEVLAVGDAEFQKKCMGKMGEVAGEGRTVLFVSHNMGAVSRLCSRGIWLEKGEIRYLGDITQAIENYGQHGLTSKAELVLPIDTTKPMQFRVIRMLDAQGKLSIELDRANSFSVQMDYEVRKINSGIQVGFMLDKADGTPVCHSGDSDSVQGGVIERNPGNYRATVEFPGGLLNAGNYQIRVCIARQGGSQVYDYREPFFFHLYDGGTFAALGAEGRQRPGVLAIPLVWRTVKSG